MNAKKIEQTEFMESTGNVFADLDLPQPDVRLAKAKLALAISRSIRTRKLDKLEAAELLQTTPARITAITNGRLANISYDRLLRFLNILGCNVRIVVDISSESDKQGTTMATIAA
jgi:predicted XRE-type DNA-binding protein